MDINNKPKRIYTGYVSDPKRFEQSGTTVYNISFKEEQLHDLLKYKTAKNQVHCDFVVLNDGKAFMTVFDPHSQSNQQKLPKANEVKEDLPF